ncbi:hypothetical protein [uncultured Pseudodesulfovibrio sp.]|uniref:hypothetical protein n=1 Tax=uncultured Pseudodesulfovibrio sp. TaxID=2035858 RepID=UPI0029C5FC19|nr:hypothetical protein [uncultured Pseudodesulfovibrio sp.]
MHAFDILAEAKMRQWEKEKKDGVTKPSANRPALSVESGDSLEKQLFADIKRLIRRSRQEPPQAGRETLKEAERVQVQLSARLEKAGAYHLSRYVADRIRALREGQDE